MTLGLLTLGNRALVVPVRQMQLSSMLKGLCAGLHR